MAEEDKKDTPEIDMDKVNDYIKSIVDTHKDAIINAYVQGNQGNQSNQRSGNNNDDAAGHKQIKDLIDPIYAADIAEAKLSGREAMDESRFYRKNHDASDYEEEIEKIFANTKQQGRPLPRQEIYDYVTGRERRTNREEFDRKEAARRERQLERAGTAVDFASYESKAKNDPQWSKFDQLNSEEQEKLIEGITF